jgi:RNA polymerase sigma-70 factor (ECF subfamily)
LRAEDRARDLVQDVLVLTLQKLREGRVREPERIGSFILGVARLKARSAGRAGARDEGIDAASEVAVDAGHADADPLVRDRVVRCLEKLPERSRSIIVLTYYGEQSTATIAASLGLTANNVRVICHRGIAELRICLGFTDRGRAS